MADVIPSTRSQNAISLKKGPRDYPMVTGTDHWKRKVRTVFRGRDTDRDGYVSKKDYEMTVHRVASYLELDENQSKDLMSIKMKLWEPFHGDMTKIAEEDFISNAMRMAKAKPEFGVDYAAIEFDAIDVNKHGFISPEQHKAFFCGFGIPTEHSPAVFKVLDTDGDGMVSKEEFVQGFVDFMLSEEEDSPNNTFLGPLVE